MGLKAVTASASGVDPSFIGNFKIGANAKNISIRQSGSQSTFYTVPTGKIFTGYMQGTYDRYPIVTTAEGHSAYLNKDFQGTYKGNEPLPIVLLAGSELKGADTSYEYSVFGVESDA